MDYVEHGGDFNRELKPKIWKNKYQVTGGKVGPIELARVLCEKNHALIIGVGMIKNFNFPSIACSLHRTSGDLPSAPTLAIFLILNLHPHSW